MIENNPNISNKEFVITRIFDAPSDLVFKAWTESERLAQWWGPKGFTMESIKLDLRPQGIFHYSMSSPDGHEMWGKFVYHEIIESEKLVFVVSFSDAQCNTVRHPMSATWPLEILNTITFSEKDGKTTVTLKGTPINASDEERKTFESAFEGLQKGFKGTMDQLVEYLAKIVTKSLTITRIFDAPRELVFKAWTDPKLLEKWWGPRGVTNPICKLDARSGGAIHIVMLAGKDLGDLEGQEWPMKGTFDEVIPHKRIVFTSSAIEDEEGNPQLEQKVRIMLEDLDGKTKMTLYVIVTKAGPGTEGPLSGMKMGWNQSIDKLSEELEKPS